MNQSAIRSGLGANLANAFAALGYQVQPFAVSAPVPPGFQLVPDRVDFHGTLGDATGMDTIRFVLIATVGFANDIASQEAMDVLLDDRVDVSDPLSVREALEADQRLTSRLLVDGSLATGMLPAANDVTATIASGYRLYPLQGGQQIVLGCEWAVEVRT